MIDIKFQTCIFLLALIINLVLSIFKFVFISCLLALYLGASSFNVFNLN